MFLNSIMCSIHDLFFWILLFKSSTSPSSSKVYSDFFTYCLKPFCDFFTHCLQPRFNVFYNFSPPITLKLLCLLFETPCPMESFWDWKICRASLLLLIFNSLKLCPIYFSSLQQFKTLSLQSQSPASYLQQFKTLSYLLFLSSTL